MEITNRNCLNCFYSCLANCNLKARKGIRICFVNYNIVEKTGSIAEVSKDSSCSRHHFEFELDATRK